MAEPAAAPPPAHSPGSPDSHASPGETPALYSGWRGALLYGAFVVGIGLIAGTAGGLALGYATGNSTLAAVIFTRLAAWGAVVGVVCGLARGWNNARVPRLLTTRIFPGDLGSIVGVMGGLALAGQTVQTPLRMPTQGPAGVQAGREIDFEGTTLEGEPYRLSDQRGRVVLVDFWATWCGPCVRELPNVVRAYERYHEQGFEVIGISLDNAEKPLRSFLEQRELPWPQILDTARAEPLGDKYGVEAIPFTVLVGRDGRVRATDLRGQQLDAEVAAALREGRSGERAPSASPPADEPRPFSLRDLLWSIAFTVTNGLLASSWLGLIGGTLAAGVVAGLLERIVRQVLGRLPPAT